MNPLLMSRTVEISPWLVLLSLLAGYSIGTWVGVVRRLRRVHARYSWRRCTQIIGREAWRDGTTYGKGGNDRNRYWGDSSVCPAVIIWHAG